MFFGFLIERKSMKRFLGTLFLVALGIWSQAQIVQPEDRRRARRQQRKIERGVREGTITPQEERELQESQREIQRRKRRAGRDGVVTDGEDRRIDRKQRRASREIRRARRDK